MFNWSLFSQLRFSGTLYVADKEDDDWVGLVFSYQVIIIDGEKRI